LITLAVCVGCSTRLSAGQQYHIEKTFYLKGKVGLRDIVIKMLCYDELPERYIHYYFPDEKKDHYLTGRKEDQSWHFEADSREITKTQLNITESKDGTWKGSWTDDKAQSKPVLLQPLVTDSITAAWDLLPLLNELDPYDQYRLANISFTKTGTEKKAGDLACAWYLEKGTGISFFRIIANGNKISTDSINAALLAMHLGCIQKYYSGRSTGITATVCYLTNELVSFQVISANMGTGNKTIQHKEYITLDLKSGQPVRLEDIIWFDKQTEKPSPDDLFKIFKYRKTVFAPAVFRLLQELYPEKMREEGGGANKVEDWAMPLWRLSSKGIVLGFNQGGGNYYLPEWAVIPYEKLVAFLQNNYYVK
jgi:hypothetical protein